MLTAATVSPSGTRPLASLQCTAGIKNSSAPLLRAPASFWRMPPIAPTAPSGVIVPVPAIVRPFARSSGLSLSMSPSVNIRPALGPPTSLSVKSIEKSGT
ncbi:unannotated protein [freshwater metagenome]|uniref:Unannotated protein n=1 Tax=freshwater metagenome TaxID=449393 RepID=A0A6J7IU04_9ZZZZ